MRIYVRYWSLSYIYRTARRLSRVGTRSHLSECYLMRIRFIGEPGVTCTGRTLLPLYTHETVAVLLGAFYLRRGLPLCRSASGNSSLAYFCLDTLMQILARSLSIRDLCVCVSWYSPHNTLLVGHKLCDYMSLIVLHEASSIYLPLVHQSPVQLGGTVYLYRVCMFDLVIGYVFYRIVLSSLLYYDLDGHI